MLDYTLPLLMYYQKNQMDEFFPVATHPVLILGP